MFINEKGGFEQNTEEPTKFSTLKLQQNFKQLFKSTSDSSSEQNNSEPKTPNKSTQKSLIKLPHLSSRANVTPANTKSTKTPIIIQEKIPTTPNNTSNNVNLTNGIKKTTPNTQNNSSPSTTNTNKDLTNELNELTSYLFKQQQELNVKFNRPSDSPKSNVHSVQQSHLLSSPVVKEQPSPKQIANNADIEKTPNQKNNENLFTVQEKIEHFQQIAKKSTPVISNSNSHNTYVNSTITTTTNNISNGTSTFASSNMTPNSKNQTNFALIAASNNRFSYTETPPSPPNQNQTSNQDGEIQKCTTFATIIQRNNISNPKHTIRVVEPAKTGNYN